MSPPLDPLGIITCKITGNIQEISEIYATIHIGYFYVIADLKFPGNYPAHISREVKKGQFNIFQLIFTNHPFFEQSICILFISIP